MQIVLTKAQRELLSKESMNNYPNESCALLFGKKEKDKLLTKEIFFTENIEKSSVDFTISNEQLIKGYKVAENKRLDVIGIFHSHPNAEPYPSLTDKKFMEINPVIWIIFSNVTNDFKAYFYETEVIEVKLVT